MCDVCDPELLWSRRSLVSVVSLLEVSRRRVKVILKTMHVQVR